MHVWELRLRDHGRTQINTEEHGTQHRHTRQNPAKTINRLVDELSSGLPYLNVFQVPYNTYIFRHIVHNSPFKRPNPSQSFHQHKCTTPLKYKKGILNKSLDI